MSYDVMCRRFGEYYKSNLLCDVAVSYKESPLNCALKLQANLKLRGRSLPKNRSYVVVE
jgi:hypothetical protein